MNKKKLALIISISIIALAGLITGGVLLAQQIARQNSAEFTMASNKYLVEHSPWHKLNDDETLSAQIIWTFNEDGTGTITTNGGLETHKMEWQLGGGKLSIKTAWLYDLIDTFEFSTDRERGTFTVVDTAENKRTTFTFAKNML